MSVLPVLAQFLKRRRLIPRPMIAKVTKATLTIMMVILKNKFKIFHFSKILVRLSR